MRNLIAALFCASLLAPASFAQAPADSPDQAAPPSPVELKLPDKVADDLRDIAKTLKDPPAPESLQLPTEVADDLRVIADALKEKDEEIPEGADGLWWTGRFFERWFWFLAFLALAGGSYLSGRRHAEHAVYLRSQTQRARALRDWGRQSNKDVEGDVATLVKATNDKIDAFESQSRRWVFRGLTGLGAVMLLVLAMLPPVTFGWNILGAKKAALAVLNSDFAAAFAGTWIAVLVFGGAQAQRQRDAETDFEVVTDEAEAIVVSKRTEVRREYERRFDDLPLLGFGPPSAPMVDDQAVEPVTPDQSKFDKVFKEAAKLGQQTKLPADADLKKLRAETNRLIRLVRPKPFRDLDFGTFLENLLREKDVVRKHRGDWESLARAYGGGDRGRWIGIKSLAQKLEADAVSVHSPKSQPLSG